VTREQRLSRVFVELADTLVAPFDVIDFLQNLIERSVELLEVDAAGLMLADQRGQLRVVASSAESARLVEIFELQNSEGPCLDCFHTGAQVVNLDTAQMRDRWPRFSAEATGLGFQSAHALPMRLREQVIGAINLFGNTEATLSEDDVAVGQAMADIATIGLLQERAGREQHVLAEQLQAALNSRVMIEQAKGVLAERVQTSPDAAFVLMRAHARNQNRRLTDVAAGLLDGTVRIQPTGDRRSRST
jgi:transcriptional regulator with GAF, ATPase, and Fis domain